MRVLLKAALVGLASLADALLGTRPPQPWVDDGLCTCPDCTGPTWLAGDNQPAQTPLPAELRDLEAGLQIR